MKIIALIVFIGIASVVFYLFLRSLFEERSCGLSNLQEEEKIKPLLPKAENVEDQGRTNDSESQDMVSEEGEILPIVTDGTSENTEQIPSQKNVVMDEEMDENQD